MNAAALYRINTVVQLDIFEVIGDSTLHKRLDLLHRIRVKSYLVDGCE